MTPTIELVQRANKIRMILAIMFVVCMFMIYFILHTPKRFYPHDLVIEEGATLQEISKKLKDDKLIFSESFFNLWVTMTGHSKNLKSGTYIFKESTSVFRIAKRISDGVFDQEVVTITIQEGYTLDNIAYVAGNKLKNFDPVIFYDIAREGHLFPDTYKFLEYTTTEEFVYRLEHRHDEIIKELLEKYPENDREIEDIIIAASIIEKEADTPEGRRMVSDIIWRRLEIDMPLQVDATFVYGIGKGTFDLTINDLVTDGAYNTYTRKGLPPTAISNPGKDSLEAAFNPIQNENIFFLTGRDGEMYYAITYEDHLLNKRRFLD